MKEIEAKKRGITLISLVITIIIMLILAGITINLTIGQDGIITRAQEAGKNYLDAAENERTQLAEFLNQTDNIIDNVTSGENNKPEPNYTMVNGVPVPKGFSPITTAEQGTKDTGFVIMNDKDGNEFVWVPCTLDGSNSSIKYDRYSFGDFLNSNYSEAMPSDEESSIRTYGGFYIGRYETGIADYTSLDTGANNTQYEYTGYTGGKVSIKAGQQVWNYITRDKAKKVSEELYSKTKGDSVNSRLCSSYAWDTALKFIENKFSTYPTNSTQGNYSDKSAELGKPARTGQTIAVNNIYDMGGNTWEWTTEACNDESYPCTLRGGNYVSISNTVPAAGRGGGSRSTINVDFSFRTTLYL